MSKQLARVLDVEQKKEQQLCRSFEQAQAEVRQQTQRLSGLQQYRINYLRQVLERAASGMGSSTLSHYHKFVATLETAEQKQQELITNLQQKMNNYRQAWLKQKTRCEAIAKVLENRRNEAAIAAERKEQKVMDEFTSQQFFRRKNLVLA